MTVGFCVCFFSCGCSQTNTQYTIPQTCRCLLLSGTRFPESRPNQSCSTALLSNSRNHCFSQSRIWDSQPTSLFLNKRCCQDAQKFPFCVPQAFRKCEKPCVMQSLPFRYVSKINFPHLPSNHCGAEAQSVANLGHTAKPNQTKHQMNKHTA